MKDVGEAAPLSTLIYRSRATKPMSPPDLLELTRAAQTRNWSEAITGLVLWDKGDFFQLLEGPEEGIARVMRSINADTRHTNVEILTWQMATRRRFANWDMKLGLGGGASTPWAREVVAPSPGSLAALRRHPQDAARIFDRLALKRFSPALEYVVDREVIPRLGRTGPAPCRGRQFANLLRSGDVESVLRFSRSLHLCRGGLLELTARLLGNDWMEDRCSEAEVTLAFCTLQRLLRLLHRPARVNGEWAGSALVTPQPGELHGLCASMSAHALRAEGWAVRCEFPDNDGALTCSLKTSWFDLLDLSLSAAFTRSDRLEALAATIRRARSASCNPALVVAVGGRAFAEDRSLVAQFGADRLAGDQEDADEPTNPAIAPNPIEHEFARCPPMRTSRPFH
ncbi:MAG: BLUF domain-containing protein [Janthinobacterium lividum]